MKCLIVQPVHEDGLRLLRENGVTPVPCPDPSEAQVIASIGACEAVITRDAGLSGRAIAAAGRLRVVVVHGAGHDAVDSAAADRAGVLVCTTPGANARSVIELALGLALAAARGIPAADRAMRSGAAGFRETWPTRELSGKTALIVGWGHIGSGFGRLLRDAFAMRVLVHSPRVAETGDFARAPSLAEGLACADLVSLHTPLRAGTHGLIGRETLAQIKRGAILINTARAGLVDETALAQALAAGTIAAAGLDVCSAGAAQGPLGAFPQVIFTPHLGGSTEEALSRVAIGAARNVLTALSGQRPATTVNAPRGWPAA